MYTFGDGLQTWEDQYEIPLALALKGGHSDVVKLLLNTGKLQINPDATGKKAAVLAVGGEYIDLITFLIDNKSINETVNSV